MTLKPYFTMDAASLHQIVAFVAVAEQRSFSGAARVLGVWTSAVSQAVRKLEAHVGSTLLLRTTRSVRTTDVGERLLSEVGPLVNRADEALDRAGARPGEVTGTLRLNVARIALDVLRPVFEAYVREHPRAQLEVSVDDRFVDIVRAGFDAGVRLGEAVSADMIAVPLSPPTRFVIVGAPAYLRARGAPADPEDLLEHACIGWRAPTTGALYRWELERRGESRRVAVRGPLVCDDTELMVRAALDGLGLAYLPELVVLPHLEAGRLEPVLEPWAPRGPGLSLYFPRGAQTLPKLRAFVDLARRAGRARRARA
jgi:DNA-binding transcriptional LysR family regulator